MKKRNHAARLKLPGPARNHPAKVTIHKLPTGVRGLGDILGGGLPEFSFNLIAFTQAWGFPLWGKHPIPCAPSLRLF